MSNEQASWLVPLAFAVFGGAAGGVSYVLLTISRQLEEAIRVLRLIEQHATPLSRSPPRETTPGR